MKFKPREVAVIGGGVICHSKGRPDANITDQCVEAYNMAREDLTEQMGKPFNNSYIDALVVSYFSDHFAGQLLGEAMIADSLGLNPKRSYRAIGGGATGGIGVENGGYYTAYYAAMAAEYAKTFQIPVDTFERHMAEVSVKNRKNAQSNPFAQTSWLNPWCVKDSKENVTGEITVKQVLESGYCATPLRLRNCCLMSDGAAVVFLASKETAENIW